MGNPKHVTTTISKIKILAFSKLKRATVFKLKTTTVCRLEAATVSKFEAATVSNLETKLEFKVGFSQHSVKIFFQFFGVNRLFKAHFVPHFEM